MSNRIRPVINQTGQVSLTQQHFQEECDINVIMKRYLQTGQVTHLQKTQAQYGYAPALTFTEAMHTVAYATEEFLQLPSEVRAHFNNDPAQFLDAAADETQRPVFEDLGLLEPNPSITPDEPREAAPAQPVVASPPPLVAPATE